MTILNLVTFVSVNTLFIMCQNICITFKKKYFDEISITNL